MASLTETAYYTRKAVQIGIVLVLSLIVLRAAFGMAKSVWLKLRPPPPPPPTVSFGKLPEIEFGEKKSLPNLSYRLETIEGGLPELEETKKVYFMPKHPSSLLALDRAKQKARAMGFVNQPEAVSEILYRWRSETEPATTLEININTGNFVFRYPYEEDPSLLTEKSLLSDELAASEAKKFLQSNGLLANDLVNGRAEFSYFRFVTPNLISAISLSEADFVKVNLFREDLDEMKIMPPNPMDALISFLLSGSRERGKRILEVKYTYFPIERETSATYPLKPVDVAWQEFQAGNGFIASLGENHDGKVVIRRVYLALFEADQEQDFLQPIYVFEGDRHFFGYVPAISPEWVE